MTGLVDWDFAVNLGSKVAGDGPDVTPADAAAAVDELRAGADRSTGLVRDFTGLVAAERTAPVLGTPDDLERVVRETGARHVVFGFLAGPDR